jgi:outer membrane protein OmpA-like peptidoglycan-associated protein
MDNRFADEALDDYDEDLLVEEEIDEFDASPPPPGTTLLTRFAFGRADLSAAHRVALTRIAAEIIARMPTTQSFFHCFFVDVEGHEDEVGDPARFGRLGQDRGLAAAQHLAGLLTPRVARLPAASRRSVDINVTTAGPTRPIRSNVTAGGRALNRRVEIRWKVDSCPGVT